MRILVDADACPVIPLIIKVAREYAIEVILFCDTSHYLTGAKVIVVGQGADRADFVLVNSILPGDIVVTQDYGLAAMSLAKKALVINQDGRSYHEKNIDSLLLSRHTARKIRKAGGRLKGSKKRSLIQDECFEKALQTLLKADIEKK